MKIKVQPTLSSCGPMSIYNIGILLNRKFDFKMLKKSCKTNHEGTDEHHFEKTLSKKFKYKKKKYYKISDLKKDLKSNYIILGYDYLLENKKQEGHYCVCELINNKVIAYNAYFNKDASKINLKTKKKFWKQNIILDYKEFNKYFNIVGYLIPKENNESN
jgi:ABC-type bacteriocin/lantibiotic exporter with double-glycine peptidase domain